MNRATVLILDDDADLQCLTQQYLETQGYKVTSAMNGAEFFVKLGLAQPDIILLDLGLPDQDGLTVLNGLRSKSKIPVIVISGRSETIDRIVGLEMGADDYLIKPFEMRELTARIKALLRRYKGVDKFVIDEAESAMTISKALSFNGWILNRMQYELFDKAGNALGLTSGEFKLLETFMTSPNRVLSREQLFEHTRKGKFDIYDRAIDIQIARIRKKMSDDSITSSPIKTVRGRGYMFCGDVKAVSNNNVQDMKQMQLF